MIVNRVKQELDTTTNKKVRKILPFHSNSKSSKETQKSKKQ